MVRSARCRRRPRRFFEDDDEEEHEDDGNFHTHLQSHPARHPCHYSAGVLFTLLRGPNKAVPTRTIVAPSSIATSKSPLIPMLNWGSGAPSICSARSRNSRSCRKTGRTVSAFEDHGGIV